MGTKITGKSKRKFRPNLQNVTAVVNGSVKRVKASTKAMRMGMVALSFPGTLAFATPERGVSVRGLSGVIANNPLGCELAGFAKILNRRLGLDLQYLDCDMDSDTAGAIMSDIRGMLDVAEGERG